MGTIRERVGRDGKSKSYHVQVRRRGYETQTRSFKIKAEAQRWERQTEASMDGGGYVSTRSAEASMTMLEALDRYALTVTPRKKSAVSEHSQIRILKTHRVFGRSLAKITSSDFAKLRDDWLLEGLAPASVVRRMAVLSNVYTVARREWSVSGLRNPFLDVTKPKVDDARARIVGHASGDQNEPIDEDEDVSDRASATSEIEYIIQATNSKLLPYAMRFALLTAMRRGEIVALDWSNVNLRARTAHLPTTKNGSARTVPLHPDAAQILEDLGEGKEHNGRVFGIRADSLTRAFDRALERARERYIDEQQQIGSRTDPRFLVGLRFHDLRHEATTKLASIFPLHELAKITGHRSTQMLLRYYHPKAQDLAEKFATHPGWA